MEKTNTILTSSLAPVQTVLLYNSTIVTAATYYMRNLYSTDSRATILKKCDEIDKHIIHLLRENNLLGKTTSNNMVYLELKYSGLGIKSIKNEVLMHYIRKGLYLNYNEDLKEVHKRYVTLQKAGYRTPLGDLEYAAKIIGLQLMEYDVNLLPFKKFINNAIYKAKNLYQEQLLQDWA